MADLQALAVQFFGIGFGGATVLGFLSKIWPDAPDSQMRNPALLEMSVAPTAGVETDAQTSAHTQEIYDTTAAIQQATEYITTVIHTETEYVAQHITVDRFFTSTSTLTHEAPTITVTQAPTLIEITDPVLAQALSAGASPAQGFHMSDLLAILTFILCILGLSFGPILVLGLGIYPRYSDEPNEEEDEDKDAAVKKDSGVQTEAAVQKDAVVQTHRIVQKDAAVQHDEIREPNQLRADCRCNESNEFWTEKHAYTEKRSLKNDDSKAMFDNLHGIFDKADHCLSRKEMADILSGELRRRASDNHRRALEIACSSEDHIRESALAKTLAKMDYATFVETDQINVSSMLLMQKGPLVENALLRNWLNRLAKTTKLVEEASAHIHAGCPDDVRDPKVRPQRFTRSPDRVRRSGPFELLSKNRDEDPTPGRSSPNDLSVSEQRDSEQRLDAIKEDKARPLLMGRHARLREVLKRANVEEAWKLRNLPLIRQIVGFHGKDIEAAAKEIRLLYEGYLSEHQTPAAQKGSKDDDTPVVSVPAIKINNLSTSAEAAPVKESQWPEDGRATDVPLPESPEPIPENGRPSSPPSEALSAEQWSPQTPGPIPGSQLSPLPPWSPLSAEQWSPRPAPWIRPSHEPEYDSYQGAPVSGISEPDTAIKASTHEDRLGIVEKRSDLDAWDTKRLPEDVDNDGEVEDSLPTPPEPTIKDAEAVQEHRGFNGQDTEHSPLDVDNDERVQVHMPTPPESTSEDAGTDHDEDVGALASQLLAEAVQLVAAATADYKVEEVPAVSEDAAFASSDLDAKSTSELAVENPTAATGHPHDSDADADLELEIPPNAPYQKPEEHKGASSVEGTSGLATEQYVPPTTRVSELGFSEDNHMPEEAYIAAQQQPSFATPSFEFQDLSHQPEPALTDNKHTPEQAYPVPQQQEPSLTSPSFEYETTSYQPESNIEELTDAWINSIGQSQPDFGFPEGPVAPESYQLPDEDSAMDGLEATGVALPAAPPPQPEPALYPVPQRIPSETATPLAAAPVPASLDEDTDTPFEDVYMPNGQTINAFQNSTDIFGPGFPNASVDNEVRENEMLDDAAPRTPSDGRGPVDDAQGRWNQRHEMQTNEPALTIDTRRRDDGYHSASDFDPFSATLPTDPDLFESQSTRYSDDVNDRQGFERNGSRDYAGAEQESDSSHVGLSPLQDASPTYNYYQDAAKDDSEPATWRYEKDEYVVSPTHERGFYENKEEEDPYAADVESDIDLPLDGSLPTNSTTPVPSVQPDYSTPPSHSTSSTYTTNPTSSTLEGFSGAKNGASAPYRPLSMSPTRAMPVPALARTPAPDSQISSAAAIALGLSPDDNSDKSSESSGKQMDVNDDQVEIEEEQAKIDADAAALMARMDISHAANVAAAAGLSQAQQPQQGFSVFEMTSRLHAFVEPNRQHLQSVKERAAAVLERSHRFPEQWRGQIGEAASLLQQRADESMRWNHALMEEWEALDEEKVKGWSWEETGGRKWGIGSGIACVEAMARWLELSADEVENGITRVGAKDLVFVAKEPFFDCRTWWIESSQAAEGTRVKGVSEWIDRMQVDVEKSVELVAAEMAAEQAEMQSAAERQMDLEADKEMKQLLGEDGEESDLSDVDEEVLSRTEDDPLARNGF